jgi:glycosyltransferase involved in cell wall biosynthesis
MPVIASPVGANLSIVNEASGILAATCQWGAAIDRLRDDPGLRSQMGLAARRRVAADFSLHAWGPRLASILREAAERSRSVA